MDNFYRSFTSYIIASKGPGVKTAQGRHWTTISRRGNDNFVQLYIIHDSTSWPGRLATFGDMRRRFWGSGIHIRGNHKRRYCGEFILSVLHFSMIHDTNFPPRHQDDIGATLDDIYTTSDDTFFHMNFASVIMPGYGKRSRKATAILPLMPQ